jgi:L-asparaginase
VVAVLAGKVHGARDVCKLQAVGLDAFSSGSADPLGVIEEGVLQRIHPWPSGDALGVDSLPDDVTAWPRVEIVMSHAGTNGEWVRTLQSAGVQGIVVAGTGNGTVHHELEAALIEAQQSGVRVLRSTRCGNGRVLPHATDRLPACDMHPAKARVELLLQLL